MRRMHCSRRLKIRLREKQMSKLKYSSRSPSRKPKKIKGGENRKINKSRNSRRKRLGRKRMRRSRRKLRRQSRLIKTRMQSFPSMRRCQRCSSLETVL